jgi:hypothetical protein
MFKKMDHVSTWFGDVARHWRFFEYLSLACSASGTGKGLLLGALASSASSRQGNEQQQFLEPPFPPEHFEGWFQWYLRHHPHLHCLLHQDFH